MLKKYFLSIINFCGILLLTMPAAAQISDGSVASLVAADQYFAATAAKKGIKEAVQKITTNQTILYRPDPLPAGELLKKAVDPEQASLSWYPSFAKVAKSGDWGITSGPFLYRDGNTEESAGHYVSVWKANNKGQWRLVLDAAVEHPASMLEPQLNFQDPENRQFFKQRSKNRLQQRVDVIISGDQLYNTIMRVDPALAVNEYHNPDSRLFFPGRNPVQGSANIGNFYRSNSYQVIGTVSQADRSFSGDLAFSRGEAIIRQDEKEQRFHYIRIWQLSPDFNWNVIIELYTPATEKSAEN